MTVARVGARLDAHGAGRADTVYRQVVIPLSDDPESLHAVPSACSLAAPDGGSLVGVFVIEVPAELPLEAHLFDAERHARDALERARAAAEACGLRFSGRIVRAHGAAGGDCRRSGAAGCRPDRPSGATSIEPTSGRAGLRRGRTNGACRGSLPGDGHRGASGAGAGTCGTLISVGRAGACVDRAR